MNQRKLLILPAYAELFYSNPENEDQQQINELLSTLCLTAVGDGWEPIAAGHRLKELKAMDEEKREEAYYTSLARKKAEDRFEEWFEGQVRDAFFEIMAKAFRSGAIDPKDTETLGQRAVLLATAESFMDEAVGNQKKVLEAVRLSL